MPAKEKEKQFKTEKKNRERLKQKIQLLED